MKIKEKCSTCGEVYPKLFDVSNQSDMVKVMQKIDSECRAWSLKHHEHGHIMDIDADTENVLSECL